MRQLNWWIGLCAVAGLSGCATGMVSSWKAADAEPLRLRGEKVAAVVMASDQAIRLAGEDVLARELSERGAEGVPMYALLAKVDANEAEARAAAERAGVVGVVVLRPVRIDKEISSTDSAPILGGFWGGYFGHGWGAPWSGGEIRTDTIVIVETLVYSLTQNKLVWGGQSKTRNPASVDGLIKSAAKQVADELVRRGLIEKAHENDRLAGIAR